jgi:hypothetical protein
MKNTPTAPQAYQTAPVVRVHSKWLPMCAGFAGWVILLVCSVGLLYLLHRYLRFPEDFEERNVWMYVLVAVYALLFCFLLYGVYERYFPRQWMTEAVVDLDEKCLTIITRGRAQVFPFSRIGKVVCQGVSPIFTTHYLYWIESEGKRIPLVALSSERASFYFYEVLERRAGLKIEQEPGN